MTTTPTPLWQPDEKRLNEGQPAAFRARAEQLAGTPLTDYRDLHRWSVTEPEAFWNLVWDFCELRGHKGERVLAPSPVFRHNRWFPDARINMAENLLPRHDTHTALVSIDEGGRRDQISYNDLHVAAGQVAAQLQAASVEPGDRVAGYMPNRIETVIAALGCAWIGAIWSSCSPDFGVEGVLDRFGQIEPKVLFACDGYQYNGKWIELDERIQALHEKLQPDVATDWGGFGRAVRNGAVQSEHHVTTWRHRR